MKYGVIIGLALALLTGTADAKPHHRHYAHRAYTSQMLYHRASDRSTAHYVQAGARPQDCYGIAWCGCWLRHTFGIADTTLNLARAWMRYPRADAHSANVVVWPNRHHVGKVLAIEGNRMQVISGNSGRGGVTTRWFPITGGFSFHRV